MNRSLLVVPLLLATGVALAEDAAANKDKDKPAPSATEQKGQNEKDGKLGTSILGNQEAQKALVIVPWKSSELGQPPGIAPILDDSRQPIDKEVFLRALAYYEIRSEATRPDGASAGGGSAAAKSNSPQSATKTHRR